jgi:hypothetical protein|tara:strand:+ start:3040 stop:4464 length:1425 start_codon:yes stop_codon:yes gene_type:complete
MIIGSINFLRSRKAYIPLLVINAITSSCAFLIANSTIFPDSKGYLLLGESIREGFTFSSWYFLPFAVPETLRTWGYPFFLFLARTVLDNLVFVKFIQYLFYLGSLFIAMKIISHISHRKSTQNLFLLFSAINIQVPYYSGLISAESLNIFFITLYAYILVTKKFNTINAIFLGLLGFVNFQLRPAFLLFPFFFLFVIVIFKPERKKVFYLLIQILVFSISLVPFGFWNYTHHGVFKVIPLEGGAGVSHISYWSFKLPSNYTNNTDWHNNVGNDVFMNLVAERSEKNVIKYENELAEIISGASIHMTNQDSARLNVMKENNPGTFILYNSAFTKMREKLFWKFTFSHILEDPSFYIKTRILSFCRFWFTGVNMSKLMDCRSIKCYAKVFPPFTITFTFIFCGLLFVSYHLISKQFAFSKYTDLYILIIYFGLCHIPFAVQARYTVPVHLLVLTLLSCTIMEFVIEAPRSIFRARQ